MAAGLDAADRAPPGGETPARAPQQRRLVLRTLLPGLYAWLTTVAHPATFRGAPVAGRVLAFLALAALVAGPALAARGQRLGNVLGIYVFVGLCVATWLLLGEQLDLERLEPVRAALGGVGWGLFALGWGQVRELGHVPEDDPKAIAGPPLVARNQLPPGAAVALGVGVVGALVPLMLAWRVDRQDHALLAHAAAIACAVAMLYCSVRVALDRGIYTLPPPRDRLGAATPTLSVLVVLLALGVVLMLLL